MDIKLKLNYNDERRIMKHVAEMNDDEKNKFNRLVEIERLQLIKQLEEKLNCLKNNTEIFYQDETDKYERLVIENNNHFCKCGFKCKRGMGNIKWRCDKKHCKLYEWK